MLFRETVAVYCENRTEHMTTHCVGRMQFLYIKQLVDIVTAVLEKIKTFVGTHPRVVNVKQWNKAKCGTFVIIINCYHRLFREHKQLIRR
jgi:hypothetical protein